MNAETNPREICGLILEHTLRTVAAGAMRIQVPVEVEEVTYVLGREIFCLDKNEMMIILVRDYATQRSRAFY